MRVLTCNSAYGRGGIGQHFAQLVEESRAAGDLDRYYTPAPKPNDPKGRQLARKSWHDWLVQYTPIRFSPGWRSYVYNELFDRQVAKRLEAAPDHFMGFVGKTLHAFERARELGARTLELVAANSHVDNVRRLHERAAEQHGLEDSWLNAAQIRKTRREYDIADTIYVHSEYTRQSFIEAGIAPERLERMHLRVRPRFQPPTERRDDDTLRIVYVGRLEATKGIPILLEAFSQVPSANKELTLVGGWSTRGMRKYMESWLADERIRVRPGDPLPVLHDSDVFVHPSYEDGYAYAPMEALACGVPAIVTEDTGMKEYIREGDNGYVVPTGRVEPIVERLKQIQAHTPALPTSLLPPAYWKEHQHRPHSSHGQVPVER